MERTVFFDRLQQATQQAMDYTRPAVVDSLPDVVRYLVTPNGSYAGKPLKGDEEIFPEDTLPTGQAYLPIRDTEGVIDFLWRGGKVPVWINVQVRSATTNYTVLRVVSATQFTAGTTLFPVSDSTHPFLVKCPNMPLEFGPWYTAKRQAGVLPTMMEYVDEMGKIKLPPWDGDLSKG